MHEEGDAVAEVAGALAGEQLGRGFRKYVRIPGTLQNHHAQPSQRRQP